MNDGATRRRLFDSGRKLFATNGFDATSVRALTKSAKANLGAVTYHFGSKRNLYLAILDQIMGDLADRTTAAAKEPGPALNRIRAIVHAFFTFFADNPDAPRFVLREIVRGETPPEVVLRHMGRNLEAVMTVIRAGQNAGEIRPVEPLMAAFTIISQPVWFAVVRRNIAAVSGVPVDRADMTAMVERHIADSVTRSLAAERAPGLDSP